jgi:MFS transporter, DHA1 family, tetracycline resistance protein
MQPTESASSFSPPQTTTPPDAVDKARRSAKGIVFLVVVIDLLGFGIVLPLLPRLGEDYLSYLFPGQLALTGLVLGLLMSSFSLMQFLFAPVWGRVSDQIGRRPILLLGLAGSAVFYALLGFALTMPAETMAALAIALMFVARIGAGVAGATIGTAQAVIADCTPPEQRKQGMAMIGMAFGIGFTFGPILGFGALQFFPDNHEAIGYTAACLSLVALMVAVRVLPETRRFASTSLARRKWLDWGALQQALRSPAIGPVILVFFLASLGFASFESTLSLLLKDGMRLDPRHSFLMFAYVGLVLFLAQGVYRGVLARHFSETTFIGLGISLMATGLLCLGGVNWLAITSSLAFGVLLALLMLALAIAVVGFSFLTPSAQALISRRTDADRQGEILGVNQSASAMARILGPVCGLILYQLTATHLLPYLFGTLLLLAMLPLLPRIRRG